MQLRTPALTMLALIPALSMLLLMLQPSLSQTVAEGRNFEMVAIGRPQAMTYGGVFLNKNISEVAQDVALDLLTKIDDNQLESMRQGSQLLVKLVDNLQDPARKDDNSEDGLAVATAAAAAATASRWEKARRRLERLARVVDSAKYEFEEMLRRKKMEPAIAVLKEIVDRMKRLNAPGRLRQQLSTVQMNLFEQTNYE
jgi:hypothetical protein